MKKPRVILKSCNTYEADKISGIIKESISELDIKISGNVFIKPNVVTANKKFIHHSYTHPAVVEAMIRVLRSHSADAIHVGESGGYGTPSRLFLKESGYFDIAKRMNVDVFDLNEREMVKVHLKKGHWHKEMQLSKYINNADFKVWMPKLKYHVFASITHALKLNMGILSHKERMLYHDYRIHEKIVDLLEPGYPDLIVSDSIDITYGMEAAPYPVRLGALLIADHPLSADVVAAYIMGYNPKEVEHLKVASQRGYGSLALNDIDISGDVDLEKLRSIPKGEPRLFQVLSELNTPIDFFSGLAPDTNIICDGGCQCAVKGCLGLIEKKFPDILAKARNGAIVTGEYHGDVIVPNGSVMLVGDCTKVLGNLKANKIYHVWGCPVSSNRLLSKVSKVFELPNPILNMRDMLLFVANCIEKRYNVFKYRFLLKK